MSGSERSPVRAGQSDNERSISIAKTMQASGCSIILRRLDGPEAREIYLSCQPSAEHADPAAQAQAIYRAIQSVLQAEGGSFASVVSETVLHRDIQANIATVRAARSKIVGTGDEVGFSSAVTEIEQAPVDDQSWLEVSIQAVVPHQPSAVFSSVKSKSTCGCAECAHSQGLKFQVGDETRFHSGSLYGRGAGAYQQTVAMFDAAQAMLQQAGMQFSDVVRTWIYLREMERDYADFNRARREFFKLHGIETSPASTGIGAGLIPEGHDLCLCVHAVKAHQAVPRILMTTPTLNEAPSYGADFSRGMRIEDANKHALYVSGTASLDETGTSVHVEDFEAQADRMLVNVAALLEAQNASFDDVVSAITYVKHAADAHRLKEKLDESGYSGFAHNIVLAPVCRPELLCETEAFAVLLKSE